MNCYAVVVTYKNRFHLLQKVLDSCLNEGVHGIIIVDNNSNSGSRQQLEKFIKINHKKTRFELLKNETNTGSSNGFTQGMKCAFAKNDCEYIWLLDDDNKPKKGALGALKKYWPNRPNKVTCLSSYRDSRLRYTRVLNGYKPNYILGPKNSFLYFHISEIPSKLINRIIPKKEKENQPEEGIEIIAAQYGGMFFHKNLLNTIGYPRNDFFVYSDDYEWSIRIHKNGEKIHLVSDSKIEDLENSWNSSGLKKQYMIQTLAVSPPFRIYYYTRNRMVFERENWITNNFIYWINFKTYTLLFNCFSKRNSATKIAFHQAIKDAQESNFTKRY